MPDQFAAALAKLRDQLKLFGKDPAKFPNALVTMFMYVTEDKSETERVLTETLTALLNRPVDQLCERLLVGLAGGVRKKTRGIQSRRCLAGLYLADKRRDSAAENFSAEGSATRR